MKRNYFFILILLFTACTPAILHTTSEVQSTHTSEVIVSTGTPAQPTATLSKVSSSTSGPSQTPLPQKSPKPTQTVTPMWWNLMEGYSQYSPRAGYSPDKQWRWGISDYGSSDPGSRTVFSTTRFVRSDGKAFWDVRPKLEQLGGIEYSDVSYVPIFWLPNEPYVYLTADVCCMDGPGVGFFTGMNLARLDLQTGEFSLQIAEWGFHEFTFSSNGKYFFEAMPQKPEVHIVRLFNWDQTTIKMPSSNYRNGGGAWSPDNEQFAFYSCEHDPINEWECKRFSLFLIDVNQMPEYRVLIQDIKEATEMEIYYGCSEMEWVSQTQIRLYSEAVCRQNGSWIVDINTGKAEPQK